MDSNNQIKINRDTLTTLLSTYIESSCEDILYTDLESLTILSGGEDTFELLIDRARQRIDSENNMKDPITLSAYILTNTYGVLPSIKGMFSTKITAKYACMTGSGDEITSLAIVSDETVAESLGLSNNIMDYISPGRVVIAGGAAMYLGCPTSLWDLSCDVDIFILDVDHPTDIVMDIVITLQKEGYIVCQYGSSVLTAIGNYGKRRIQIIKSTARTPYELIRKFDMNIIKVFYDGFLNCTYSAIQDWSDKKCRNLSITPIKALRLARAFLKGFDLCYNTKKYLNNTIGWPLTEEVKNKLLHNIPCLNRDIPEKVQYQILSNIGLIPVGKGDKIRIGVDGNGLVGMGNSYGSVDIFKGSMEEFVENVEEDTNICSKNYENIKIIYLKSKYLISLPLCSIPFSWKGNYDYVLLSKLSIVEKDEETKFCKWHDAICNKILPNCNVDTLVEKYSDVHIRVNKNCKWWKNGIKTDGPFDLNTCYSVRVVCKASHITMLDYAHSQSVYIKFDVIQMYVHTTEQLLFSNEILLSKEQTDSDHDHEYVNREEMELSDLQEE
jgi:hypothetical protein